MPSASAQGGSNEALPASSLDFDSLTAEEQRLYSLAQIDALSRFIASRPRAALGTTRQYVTEAERHRQVFGHALSYGCCKVPA